MYRKTDPLDAARCIDVAINQYLTKGNFRRAATQKQNLAEIYEEIGDQKKAIESYETAARLDFPRCVGVWALGAPLGIISWRTNLWSSLDGPKSRILNTKYVKSSANDFSAGLKTTVLRRK